MSIQHRVSGPLRDPQHLTNNSHEPSTPRSPYTTLQCEYPTANVLIKRLFSQKPEVETSKKEIRDLSGFCRALS